MAITFVNMKIFAAFFAFLFFLYFQSSCGYKNTKEKVVHDSVVVTVATKKAPGKFPEEINNLLHLALPHDSGSVDRYNEPDSSNTHLFRLSRDTNEVYLIETEAGYMTGSCGWLVMAFRIKNNLPEIFFNECGSVDSIFRVSHNGLYDFSVRYRYWVSETPLLYRFNGKEFVEYNDPTPPSLQTLLARVITAYNPKDAVSSYGMPVLFEYITLGNSTYMLARHYCGVYIVREFSSDDLRVINYFEKGESLDIMEKETGGMNDIKVWEGLTEYSYYKWDGKKYVWKERRSIM
jgi:hypothetical protein